jgi:hypothetical protein
MINEVFWGPDQSSGRDLPACLGERGQLLLPSLRNAGSTDGLSA